MNLSTGTPGCHLDKNGIGWIINRVNELLSLILNVEKHKYIHTYTRHTHRVIISIDAIRGETAVERNEYINEICALRCTLKFYLTRSRIWYSLRDILYILYKKYVYIGKKGKKIENDLSRDLSRKLSRIFASRYFQNFQKNYTYDSTNKWLKFWQREFFCCHFPHRRKQQRHSSEKYMLYLSSIDYFFKGKKY